MKAPIYEDNHLLILDKPPGLLVQGDKTGDNTLTDWAKTYIKKKYQKPGDVFLHPTHRLDRPVGGLVIFARTSKALDRMNKMFRDDQIQKKYLTIVRDYPENPEATLIHWLEKNNQNNTTKAYNTERKGAKRSELSYELLGSYRSLSLLMVKPKTGRPHQIRVQLAKLGNPIEGDLRYGFERPNKDKSISLHAYQLAFIHPVKKEPIKVKSKPDWQNFKDLIDELD